MRQVVDGLVWFFLLGLFVPAFFAIASWGAVPGDVLFPVKLTLEDAVLAMTSPSEEANGKLMIKFTERRFSEAQQLLADQHAVTGLPYLVSQVKKTKSSFQKTDSKESRELKEEYIETLKGVITDLEKEKREIVRSDPNPKPQAASSPVPTKTPERVSSGSTNASGNSGSGAVAQPTARPTAVPTALPSVTSVTSGDSTAVVIQIEETQAALAETIEALGGSASIVTSPSPTPAPSPTMVPTAMPTVLPTVLPTAAPTESPHQNQGQGATQGQGQGQDQNGNNGTSNNRNSNRNSGNENGNDE